MRFLSAFSFFCVFAWVSVTAQPLPPGGVTVVISEIMYDMPGTSDSLEYIELRNPSDTNERTLNLYKLTEAVDFTFPAGLIVPPNGTVVVAKDSVAFQNTFGYEAYQWHSGELSDNGELIVLRNNFNLPVDSVNYQAAPPWPNASGNGRSIVLCNDTLPNLGHQHWSQASNNTGITVDGIPIFANPGTNCNGWVGIDNVDNHGFEIYPNPSNGRISIRLKEPLNETGIRIADASGKTVFSENLANSSELIQLKLDLAEGIYMLTLTSGKNTFTKQLVILE